MRGEGREGLSTVVQDVPFEGCASLSTWLTSTLMKGTTRWVLFCRPQLLRCHFGGVLIRQRCNGLSEEISLGEDVRSKVGCRIMLNRKTSPFCVYGDITVAGWIVRCEPFPISESPSISRKTPTLNFFLEIQDSRVRVAVDA